MSRLGNILSSFALSEAFLAKNLPVLSNESA